VQLIPHHVAVELQLVDPSGLPEIDRDAEAGCLSLE